MGSAPPPTPLRRPGFLAGAPARTTTVADFARLSAPRPPPPEPAPTAPEPQGGGEARPSPPAPTAFPVGLAELRPAPTPPPPQAGADRVAQAVESLKAESQRLAALAKSDALEIGFMVAERVLEQEIAGNPRALMSLVRSTLRRLADARHVTLYLCPKDAERLQASTEERLELAKVTVVADPALSSGDCRVSSELGSVDGRLSARLTEIRRSIDSGGEP